MDIQERLQAGIKKFQEARFPEAEREFASVLEIDPRQPDALHLLGLTVFQLGKIERAIELIGEARDLRPDIAQFHDSLASVWNNRGTHLYGLERDEESLASYDKAVAIKPGYAQAWNNRGIVLQRLKRYADALDSHERALAIAPDDAEAHNNRGSALHALERHTEALISYNQALATNPNHAEASKNRGNVLQILKRHEEALPSYGKAIEVRPDFAEALFNRGRALYALKRYADALADFDRALAVKSDDTDALLEQGNARHHLERYTEALASYDKLLALEPGHLRALCNRGITLMELKRYGEALACYDKALAIDPGFALAHWNESWCRLLTGDLERGWKNYEWRWKWDDFPWEKREFSGPRWRGEEDIAGKTILLYADQGLGDTIQFFRYAPLVAAKGANVVLEVQPALKSLLTGAAGTALVFSQGDPLPRFDFHCPLASLPLAFNTRLDSIPASIPYLKANAAARDKWENKLGKRTAPRVGLVWSGNPRNPRDLKRSAPLASLLPLLKLPVQLISLQKDLRHDDQRVLNEHAEILHVAPEIRDFSDTAALVSMLDLVIAVDTAVAHLAGALGKPVWILLPYAPDWRWLMERRDSPWYPTARLFRQPKAGDWTGVMQEVGRGLVEFAKKTPVAADATDAIAPAERELAVGQELYEQGHVDRAVAYYRKAIKLDPALVDAQRCLGLAYMQKRRFSEALGCYREATELDPKDPLALEGAASALRELGKFTEARRLFQRALWLKLRRFLRL